MSRAKTSAKPGSELGSPANDRDSGPSSLGSFASYDHDSYSWKMSQIYFGGEQVPFLETWPRSGTMRAGRIFASGR